MASHSTTRMVLKSWCAVAMYIALLPGRTGVWLGLGVTGHFPYRWQINLVLLGISDFVGRVRLTGRMIPPAFYWCVK